MKLTYKPDAPIGKKQSTHDALADMLGEWSDQYAKILLDVLEGKLVGSDLAIQKEIFGDVIAGTDTQLSVYMTICNAILYERLAMQHKELDIIITKKDIGKKASFSESYLNIRRSK